MSAGARRRGASSRIHVVLRVRPLISEDVELGLQLGDEYADECIDEIPVSHTIHLRKPYFDTREFSFDTVLGRGATQADTYEAVGRPVVDDVLLGFNGTVLAYGQTGTGKSVLFYVP
jgi:hypothetical protein